MHWDNLKKVGSQKFLRLVHASSYTPNSVKHGTIIGEFIRQKTYTNDPDLLNTVNKKLCIELLSIGYTKKQLKNLLLRCKITYKFDFLQNTWDWLKNIDISYPVQNANIKHLAIQTDLKLKTDLAKLFYQKEEA